MFVFCFFFFQAEDGIRDIGVTGVQTCALPISSVPGGGGGRGGGMLGTPPAPPTCARSNGGPRCCGLWRGGGPGGGRERGGVGERGKLGGGRCIKKKKNIYIRSRW